MTNRAPTEQIPPVEVPVLPLEVSAPCHVVGESIESGLDDCASRVRFLGSLPGVLKDEEKRMYVKSLSDAIDARKSQQPVVGVRINSMGEWAARQREMMNRTKRTVDVHGGGLT